MAKAKAISLRGAVREITDAQKLLAKAKKKATPAGKKKLDLEIKKLGAIKRDLILRCHGTFSMTPA